MRKVFKFFFPFFQKRGGGGDSETRTRSGKRVKIAWKIVSERSLCGWSERMKNHTILNIGNERIVEFLSTFPSFFFLIFWLLVERVMVAKSFKWTQLISYLPWIIFCNSTSNITQHFSRCCASVPEHSQCNNGCDWSLFLCITTVRNIVAVEQRVDSLKLNKTLKLVSYIYFKHAILQQTQELLFKQENWIKSYNESGWYAGWMSLFSFTTLFQSCCFFFYSTQYKRELLKLKIQITEIKKIHICWVWILVYTILRIVGGGPAQGWENVLQQQTKKPRLCRVWAPSGMEWVKVSVSGEKWMGFVWKNIYNKK